MKKMICVFVAGLALLTGCSKKVNSEVLASCSGTYMPEAYVASLDELNSHVKASNAFRKEYSNAPNVVVLSPNGLDFNFNFHEGYVQELVSLSSDSMTVESYDGKHVYKLEGNDCLYVEDVKYVKIDDATSNSEAVVGSYLAKRLLPQHELSDGENTFCVQDGNVLYNGELYTYGVELVFVGHQYDRLNSNSSDATKFVEVKENQLNVYTAHSPDNQYEEGWEENAVYELESSFSY